MTISPWLTFEKIKEYENRISNIETSPSISKTILTSDTDFYLSTTGDDSNPGTETEPFATLPGALDHISQNYCLSGFNVNIVLRVEPGTYNTSDYRLPEIENTEQGSGFDILIISTTSDLEDVDFNFTGTGFAHLTQAGATSYHFRHVTFTGSSASSFGFNVLNSSIGLQLNAIRFRGTFLAPMYANFQGIIRNQQGSTFIDTITCENVILCNRGLFYNNPFGQGPTLYDNATVTINDAFIKAQNGGLYLNESGIFNVRPGATITGKKFELSTAGAIVVRPDLATDLNQIHGDVAGTFEDDTVFYNEVTYTNTTSGLAANTKQDAIDEVATGNLEILGPFADDTAAAGGGVALNQFYYTAAGDIKIRLT